MQLLELPVQLLQAAVGGPEELLHVAQVAAVGGRPPQVLHTLLDFQLLLDGPADRLFLVLWGPLAQPRLWDGRRTGLSVPAAARGRKARMAPRTHTQGVGSISDCGGVALSRWKAHGYLSSPRSCPLHW